MARDEKVGETLYIELTPSEAAELIATLANQLVRGGESFTTSVIPMDDPKDTGRKRRIGIYVNNGMK